MHFKTLVFALATASSLLAQSTARYHVTQSYPLGGSGGWDYIIPDPANHRLYIARETRLMVVDEQSGKLVGEVGGINGAHGTAIAAKSGHGFATAGEDKAVVMFDLKTLKVLGKIPAADDADAIVFDDVSNRVFTLNGDAHSSTVIDATGGKLITNIPLKGKPEYGVSAGDGKVYANLVDTSEIVEIDAKKATVTKRWSSAPCKQRRVCKVRNTTSGQQRQEAVIAPERSPCYVSKLTPQITKPPQLAGIYRGIPANFLQDNNRFGRIFSNRNLTAGLP
jgi:hypothetical protein